MPAQTVMNVLGDNRNEDEHFQKPLDSLVVTLKAPFIIGIIVLLIWRSLEFFVLRDSFVLFAIEPFLYFLVIV